MLRRAEALLKAPHSAERILRCWGGGVDNTFTRTRDYIANMLRVWIVPISKRINGALVCPFQLACTATFMRTPLYFCEAVFDICFQYLPLRV